MLAAALALVPAIWTIGAIGVLAFGVLPRQAVALVWLVWLLVNLFGESIGPALGVDYWIANAVVPMHHIPKLLTGGQFTATPLIVLTGLTAVFVAFGLTALRRRDLT